MRPRRPALALVLAPLVALALGAATGARGPAAVSPRASATSPTSTPARERLVLALLEPERIASVDVATGATAQLRLPGGTLCRGPLLVVGGRIVFVVPGRRGGRVLSVDLALRERPRRLARTDVAVASVRPGHVWLARRAADGRWAVRDLTVRRGALARMPRRAPAGMIVGAVREGLVLQGRHAVFAWDPRSGRRTRGTPGSWALAMRGPLLASCGGGCATLLLTDGAHGRVVHAPPGRRFRPTGAVLSPAGDRLAVGLVGGRRPGAALVETATGALRMLRGARLGGGGALAFAPDGQRLYAVDRFDRVRAFALDGRALGRVSPSFHAPVAQLLAASARPLRRSRVPRFAWLPPGWRQSTTAPTFAGAPTHASVLATSWRYRPAPHGPAGALPDGGIMVSALMLPSPHAETPAAAAPRLVLPARPAGALEGRPDVPEYRISAPCGRRRLDVRVDVAAPALDPARRALVQRMLDALVLPGGLGGCRGGP